jgi:uncharacterized protein YndB with AHSA1/START domain
MARRTSRPPGRGSTGLEPIRRTILVSWDQAAAFRRFTEGFATWWPSYSHSIGGPRIARVVFECRPEGQIYEEHHDGTRFAWGRVVDLEPPRRVAFTWHAAYAEADAQQIEVTFTPTESGTRVDLVSSGWEAMRGDARKSYSGYRLSWSGALAAYAGRINVPRLVLVAISACISMTGGRRRFMSHSHGRTPPPPPIARS